MVAKRIYYVTICIKSRSKTPLAPAFDFLC